MDGSGTAHQVDRAAVTLGLSETGATHTREVDPLTVTQRLQREGRWKDIESERNEMMKLARKQGMSKSEAQAWVYAELDRMYRPLEKPTMSPSDGQSDDPEMGTMSPSGGGQIQGLGDIPEEWPDLPSNASLSAEIGWVQANRLRIVEERPGRSTLVRLERAHSPGPSWATLGWLETSVRSYAKFVDVAAKVSGGSDDEGAVMRRERRSVEEVRALLAEMEDADGVCQSCGRPR
jgi:hypothetical protein